MESIENPGKKYNIGVDAETNEVMRMDTEKRYGAAYGLFISQFAKSRLAWPRQFMIGGCEGSSSGK